MKHHLKYVNDLFIQAESMKKLTAKGRSTRDRILDETMKVLRKHWYDGVSLREIAKRCGIKLGNLQYYFQTREALFYALIERQAEQDNHSIAQALAETEDAEKALELIICDLVRRWRGSDGVVYVVLQMLRGSTSQFADLYRSVYRRHYDSLEPLIERINPSLSSAERAFQSRLITSLIDGATMQIVSSSQSKAFVERVIAEAKQLARSSTSI